MMNFTQTVKAEIYNTQLDRGDEIASEIIGYLSTKNKLQFKSVSGVLDDEYLNRIKVAVLSSDFKIKIEDDNVIIESEFILRDFIKKSDNQIKRAFLRGAFISNGSISDPKRSYHMEIEFKHIDEADLMLEICESIGLKISQIIRRDNMVLYIKDRNSISDALTLMGALKSTLEFEEELIINSTRNDVNRRVNCESANLTKTIVAGLKQIEAIEKLQEHGAFERLDKNLYDIGLLRLANPDASLNELVMLSGNRITKSGINHRLKKIIEIAEKL